MISCFLFNKCYQLHKDQKQQFLILTGFFYRLLFQRSPSISQYLSLPDDDVVLFRISRLSLKVDNHSDKFIPPERCFNGTKPLYPSQFNVFYDHILIPDYAGDSNLRTGCCYGDERSPLSNSKKEWHFLQLPLIPHSFIGIVVS